MNHLNTYLHLLSPAVRGALIEAIREQGYFESLKLTDARVVDAQPYPYLLVDVESNPNFVALAGGMLLDLDGLIDPAPSERYYFPYVGLTPRAEADTLEHELEHLDDLLELLRVEPSYAKDVEALGMTNIRDPKLLAASTRFEVRKLFLLEAPAYAREFDSGKRDLELPLLPGLNVKYRCPSRIEYVRLWMKHYLDTLEDMYLERFPEHEREIEAGLRNATNELGVETLGKNPWKSMETSWEVLPKQLAKQLDIRIRVKEVIG